MGTEPSSLPPSFKKGDPAWTTHRYAFVHVLTLELLLLFITALFVAVSWCSPAGSARVPGGRPLHFHKSFRPATGNLCLLVQACP